MHSDAFGNVGLCTYMYICQQIHAVNALPSLNLLLSVICCLLFEFIKCSSVACYIQQAVMQTEQFMLFQKRHMEAGPSFDQECFF